MKPEKFFLGLLVILTALRITICAHVELRPHEAYWYLCSTHPAWAYYDIPGGLSAITRFSTAVFGISPFGLRILMPLFAFVTSICVLLISKKHLTGWLAVLPAAAMNLIPVFNRETITLGWEMPALTMVTIALASAWTALEKERNDFGWWLLAGLAATAAVLIHVSMIFVMASILTALLSVRKFRHKAYDHLESLSALIRFSKNTLGPLPFSLRVLMPFFIALVFFCLFLICKRYLGHGISIFYAFYHMIVSHGAKISIFAVAILTVLFCIRKFRRKVLTNGLYIFLLCPAIAAVSLIWWNYRNDWLWLASGTVQSATDFSLASFSEVCFSALLELTPLFFAIALVLFYYLIIQMRDHVRPRLLGMFILSPLLLWLYLALLGISHPVLLILPLVILFIFAADLLKKKHPVWLSPVLQISLIVAALTSAWSIKSSSEPWAAIAAEFQQTRDLADSSAAPLFLIAQDADKASILSYHLARNEETLYHFPPVFVRESQGIESQFSLWPRYEQFVDADKAPDEFFTEVKATNPYMGKSALYFTDEAELPQTIQGAFQSVKLLKTLTLPLQSGGTHSFHIYLCENYQTMPL